MAEPKTPTSLLYRIFSLKSELSKINEAVQKNQAGLLYPQVGQRNLSVHLDQEVARREEELRRSEVEYREARRRGYTQSKSDYQYLFVRYRESGDKNLPELLFELPAKKGERDLNQDVWRELVTGGSVDQRGKLLFQPQYYKEAYDEASTLGKDEVDRRYFERVERLARHQVRQDLGPLLSQELVQQDLTSHLAQRTYEHLTWNLPVAPWSSSLPSLQKVSWEIARGYLKETAVHQAAVAAYYGQSEETGSIMRLRAARQSAVKAVESAVQRQSSRRVLENLIGSALEKALGDTLAPDVWQSVQGALSNSVLSVLGRAAVPDSVPEFSFAVKEGALDLVRRDVSVHGETETSYYLAPADELAAERAAVAEVERVASEIHLVDRGLLKDDTGAMRAASGMQKMFRNVWRGRWDKAVAWLISPKIASQLYPIPLKARVLPKWILDLEKTKTSEGSRRYIESKLWSIFRSTAGVRIGLFTRRDVIRKKRGKDVIEPRVAFSPLFWFSKLLRRGKGKFAEKFLLGGLTGGQRRKKKKDHEDQHLPVLLVTSLFTKVLWPLAKVFLASVDKYLLGGRATKYWGLAKGWIQTKWFALEQGGTLLGKVAQSLRVGGHFFQALIGGWSGGAGFGIIGYFLSGGNPLVAYLSGGLGWAAKSLSILASSQSFLGLATQNLGPISSLARFLSKFAGAPLGGGKVATWFKLPIKGSLTGFGIGYILGGPVGGAIGAVAGGALNWVWSTRALWMAKLGVGLSKIPFFAKLASKWAALKNFLAPLFKIFGLPGKILGWIFGNTLGGAGFWMGIGLGIFLKLPLLQVVAVGLISQGSWLILANIFAGSLGISGAALAPFIASLSGWSLLGQGLGALIGTLYGLPAGTVVVLQWGLGFGLPLLKWAVAKYGWAVLLGPLEIAYGALVGALFTASTWLVGALVYSGIASLMLVSVAVFWIVILIGTAWSMFTWPQHLPIQPSDKITIRKTVSPSSLSLNDSVQDIIFTIDITNVSDEAVEIEEFTDLLKYTAACGTYPSGFEYGSPSWDKSTTGYGVIFFDRNGDGDFDDLPWDEGGERWEDSMTDMRGFPYGFAGASDWPLIAPGTTHTLKLKLAGVRVSQEGTYANELIVRAKGEPTYQKSATSIELTVGRGGCQEKPRGWPTAGCVTQGPGAAYSHSGAEAIDVGHKLDGSGGLGTPVKASHRGTVVSICGLRPRENCNSVYGKYVEIVGEGGGFRTRYAHLGTIALQGGLGTSVTRGQLIGTKGNTGNSTAIHLHYEFLGGLEMREPYVPEDQGIRGCAENSDQPCPTICFDSL